MKKEKSFSVPLAKTAENKLKRKKAFKKLMDSLGSRGELAKLLKVDVTIEDNFLYSLKYLPAKYVDKYGVDGFELFTKAVDSAGLTQEDLSPGIPLELFSIYVITDDKESFTITAPSTRKISELDKELSQAETKKLFDVFGMQGVLKLFQVDKSTAINWAYNQKKISANAALSIEHMPQLKSVLKKYGFTAKSLRPDLFK
ncbi:MAG: hypothetical protein ACPGUE_11145 [Marinomonas sp.]